jgi:hypothetical protein
VVGTLKTPLLARSLCSALVFSPRSLTLSQSSNNQNRARTSSLSHFGWLKWDLNQEPLSLVNEWNFLSLIDCLIRKNSNPTD